MADTKSPLDNNPSRIVDAYDDFKGSIERSSIPEAEAVVDTVHTARTNQWRAPGTEDRLGETVPSVTVYLKGMSEEIPDVVERVANRHDLTPVETEARYAEVGLKSVVYVRDEDALRVNSQE